MDEDDADLTQVFPKNANQCESDSKKKKDKFSFKRQRKDWKLISVFLKRFLPDINIDLKSNDDQGFKYLLLDNRDYKIDYSTEDLMNLLNEFSFPFDSFGANSGKTHLDHIVEDFFVLPSKTFFLLKFKQSFKKIEFVDQFMNQLAIQSYAPISETIFELTIKKFQPIVNQIVDCFHSDRLPQGLSLMERFISQEEEDFLLKFAVESFEMAQIQKKISKLKNRTSIHFGFQFDYDKNSISIQDESSIVLEPELPQSLSFLLDRFRLFLPERPDQLTINRYEQGDHIPLHCDTHSMCTEWIGLLSINQTTVMSWREIDNSQESNDGGERYALTKLSACSFLVISDEARFGWLHGIVKTPIDIVPMFSTRGNRLSLIPRSKVRYSFTFRKTTSEDFVCQCRFCQSSFSKMTEKESDKEQLDDASVRLESHYVHETYEQIAKHFSSTRYKGWPRVIEFLDSLAPGSLLLDVGCGNGRFLNCSNVFSIGTDRSRNLLKLCRNQSISVETFQDDCIRVSQTLRTGVFDAVISIAVIHHLSSEERRQQAIQALIDLLSFDGRSLIYVWAFEQKSEGKKSKYLLRKDIPVDDDGKNLSITENENSKDRKNSNLPMLPIHKNRTEFQQQDVLVPWTNDGEKFFRFYHVFRQDELESMIEKISDNQKYRIELIRSYYDEGNWCVELIKKHHG